MTVTVSYADTLRRAINELGRLRAIEQSSAIGDYREVGRLFSGCDPEEITLLVEALRELQFIVRTYEPPTDGLWLSPHEASALAVLCEPHRGKNERVDVLLARLDGASVHEIGGGTGAHRADGDSAGSGGEKPPSSPEIHHGGPSGFSVRVR